MCNWWRQIWILSKFLSKFNFCQIVLWFSIVFYMVLVANFLGPPSLYWIHGKFHRIYFRWFFFWFSSGPIPRHDTVKLDDGNYVQWQQHVRLIIEGHKLQGFLDGTLPIPARFVTSPNGTLIPNPDASFVTQQDKLLASWLLSTVSTSLLSYFISAKTACDIWSTANRFLLLRLVRSSQESRIKKLNEH